MKGDANKLQLWQAGLGLLAAIVGVFAIGRHGAAQEKVEPLPAPIGPAGFGEVPGGGGGGGGFTASAPTSPAPPRGGEQTGSAGNETPRGPNGVTIGKLVPKVIPQPAPGESQTEYEQRRRETALPGARARQGNPA